MARVLVIRQGRFPLDPRVRREVGALLDAGHEVDIVCLRGRGEPAREREGRLRVRRLPIPHGRGGVARYGLQYGAFFVAALSLASAMHLRRRYGLVQVHSLPDPLVFAAAVPRVLGARVLLDLHECMPEFFATKFGVGLEHPVVRLLARLEQASIAFADRVITCTEEMRQAFVERGAPREKIAVVLNSADETVFRARERARPELNGRGPLLVTHGSLEDRYGVDTAVRAVALLADELPGLRLEVYGDGSQLPALRQLAAELGVDGHVRFSGGFVPLPALVAALDRADAGIVAVRRDRFRDLTQCNKMYELIAMGTPVITSRTRSVESAFDADCFLWFESGDEHGLAEAVRRLAADPGLAERLARRAAEAAEPYRWPRQRAVYRRTVAATLDRRALSPLPARP